MRGCLLVKLIDASLSATTHCRAIQRKHVCSRTTGRQCCVASATIRKGSMLSRTWSCIYETAALTSARPASVSRRTSSWHGCHLSIVSIYSRRPRHATLITLSDGSDPVSSFIGLELCMNLRNVDLNLLVVLDALLSERNVSRAAQRIGLSQSAMSAALARLREVFHDPLLVRVGRGLALTRNAEDLIVPIRDALSRIEQALLQRPGFDPAVDARTFSISASDYASLVLLTRFVRGDCIGGAQHHNPSLAACKRRRAHVTDRPGRYRH
ncbi:MAG: LysR family transcriptional regulator [Mucilaginibacter sp.]|nr:LysR family transcriptional regulator [Mucilaginibacter sp.]